jgi:hypothetical protein
MKTSEYNATEEKRILTGMIVSDVVLGRVAEKWQNDGLFRVRWANLVGRWCVKYFARYGKAPRSDIEALFRSWANRANDDSTVNLVDRFLSGLSDDYKIEAEEINPDYLVDVAGEHFNAVRLEQMAETVAGHVKAGEVAKALDTVGKWDKVEMGTGAGIDVLGDQTAIREAFETVADPLITYPGALGRFFGDQFSRDEFVAITGATGRGKTWWLLDIAWMGIRQGRRVAFFEVGDMSQNQIMRRFMCRASGHPIKPPYEFEVPVEINRGSDQPVPDVVTETQTCDGPLQWGKAWESCKRKMRRHKKPLLRLSVHPNSSITVDGIVGILNVWERAGWIPDVVVIDYADILATPAGYTPGDREAINVAWKSLRSLSQRRHILVLTATQADAASYTANIIRQGNFSDDRRKNDHVTGMLGINATEEERAAGVFRLNWTKRREEAYTESRCVYVAGCLHIGRPHMKSIF